MLHYLYSSPNTVTVIKIQTVFSRNVLNKNAKKKFNRNIKRNRQLTRTRQRQDDDNEIHIQRIGSQYHKWIRYRLLTDSWEYDI